MSRDLNFSLFVRNKGSQASYCTKTQLCNFININVFFFIINSFFWNSSSLSTNRKQTVCTTDRTPTALSIHKVKMNIFLFLPAFSSPPIPTTTTTTTSSATTLGPSGSEASLLKFVWEKLCAWAVRWPVLSDESSIWWVWLWWWRVGGEGRECCCLSSFGRTTSCRSYYGSTVDTTGVSINTHARTAGSLLCL